MKRKLVLITFALIGIAVFAGWWFLLRDDAPPPPDLESAIQIASAAQAATTTTNAVTVPSTTLTATSTTEVPTTIAPTSTTMELDPNEESDIMESARKHMRVINVDESWLNQTRFLRRTWVPSQAPSTFRDKQVHPRISLILALDTDGRIYFALTQANTDANIMTLFLRSLVHRLNVKSPGWEESTVILLDNAAWHSSNVMKERLAMMRLPII